MTSPLKVVYEDERLLVLDKPCGLTVIPGRGDREPSLAETASARAGAKLFVVHRLDRETSGIVVFAKDAASHRELCRLFEDRRVEKTYLALVEGILESPGVVEKPLREFGSGRVAVDERGKDSLTRYSVRERLRGATLLEVRPTTGRRHQIRVHLYAIGHPVLGDDLYGPGKGTVPRLMLHAYRIAFQLEGQKQLAMTCEPPPQFLEILAGFGSPPAP